MGKKITSPFSKYELITQEETLEISRKKGELLIGIPKETQLEEKRVCLTPDAVSSLVAQGNQVVLESGAGEGSNLSDKEYSEAGAKICYDVKEAFGSFTS
jgi:alanine dehydrogenase